MQRARSNSDKKRWVNLSQPYPVGVTTISWDVTDENNNEAETVTQTITITDNEKPVITHNGDQSVNSDSGQCGATVSISATASDNCNVPNPTATRSDGQSLNVLYPVGTTTITWNVTDENNNDAETVTQTITVTDNERPVISHNGDQSVNTDSGQCGATVSVSATATDNCNVPGSNSNTKRWGKFKPTLSGRCNNHFLGRHR